MIAVGVRVAFEFTLPRGSLADPIERRSGVGVVVSNREYGVWPAPGYAIVVDASPNYAPGEVIRACAASVRPLPVSLEISRCPRCGQPTHPAESNDDGVCAECLGRTT